MDTRKHKGLKRVLVAVLTLTMAFSCMDWSFLAVYAAEDDQPAQQTEQLGQEPEQVPEQEQEDPAKAEPSAGDVDQTEPEQEQAAEPEEEGPALPAFEQTVTEAGVNITVAAGEGVFPEDATLMVTELSKKEEKAANAVVDKARDNEDNVAASYSFDIKVVDQYGNELQPPAGESVDVSFQTAEVKDKLLTPEVYHIDGTGKNAVAQLLESSEKGDVVTAKSDGFSVYVVVFAQDGETVEQIDGEEGTIVTYKFYDGNTEVRAQDIKAGDKLYEPSVPVRSGKSSRDGLLVTKNWLLMKTVS